MSTRWYPIYQKGNPQLRVFLPNFWMKLVAPEHSQPKNMVQFHCSMEMTKHDVKNYLEKIYNVPVVSVGMRIRLGAFHRLRLHSHRVIKEDDVKIAYVVLRKDDIFEFPNLLRTKKEKDVDFDIEKNANIHSNAIKKYKRSVPIPGVLPWFKG